MRSWKGRLHASCIHLGVSLSIAALAAVVVFGLWYPYPYREISGGRSLFLLVVFVDVVMGPLITLVIFNRNKPRRELMTDFLVVGLLQLAALSYGIWTVFVARPVHLVFEYNRMAVVHAIDVDLALLSKAPRELQKLPMTGPTAIALRPFKNSAEQIDATIAAMGGAPLPARSDLWQPYRDSVVDILKEAKPVAELETRFPSQVSVIYRAVESTGKTVPQLRYLPLLGRNNAWTVLLDAATAEPAGFIPLDSF
ncbi:pilus assembly protein [Diaphorobacter sp. JS3050]|uniref:TfpX/TfpZ family type IV pilin accessory protein n=1 Tax=Diaphorobacter sp. JS3050 TaxID=2735554 RepID=UPI0015577C74|nr:TfpX/TfpZ family type IV pilin accessory protein [Diaphorobacter sp. JS3050]QJY34749.1 pilus assembly protein [Diaphorobacter sp. JS3050]